MIIQICVGSACHLKGSEQLVDMFRSAIEKNKLQREITLAGSFCTGKCNREGVTITVDDEIHTGITPEKFDAFFEKEVLDKLKQEGVKLND